MTALDDLGDLGADDDAAGPAPAVSEPPASIVERTSTLDFLTLIWPRQGHYVIALLFPGKDGGKPGFWSRPFHTIQDAAAFAVSRRDDAAVQVYHGVHTFARTSEGVDKRGNPCEKIERTQDNAAWARSIPADWDVGESNPGRLKYKTYEDAVRGCRDFCRATGLPKPTLLVNSGYGLHSYWIFNEDIPIEVWEPIAQRVLRLMDCRGACVDREITIDAARVLRPVNSFNRKTPGDPRRVALACPAGAPLDLAAFLKLLDAAEAAIPELPPLRQGPARNTKAGSGLILPESNLQPPTVRQLAAVCGTFQRMAAEAKTCNGAVWRNTLCLIRHTTGGEAACFKASEGHPEFDPVNVQAHLDRWRGMGSNGMGPPRCGTLQALYGADSPCPACPHFGQPDSSPVAIARREARPSIVALSATNEVSSAVDGGTLPNLGARPAYAVADVANGQRFAAAARHRLLYLHDIGRWMQFDPASGWTAASTVDVEAFGKAVVEAMFHEAAEQWRQDREGSEAKRLRANVDRVSRLPHLRAMVDAAKSEPGMAASLADFDADALMLGVRNGVVDLRTGELRQATPDVLVSKRCPVEFDPGADCPRFKAFLAQVLPDPEVRAFMTRWLGYCLTGSVEDQVFLFLHGGGFNGKSVLVDLVAWLLGDYARKLPTEALMHQQRSAQGPDPDTLLLKGRRFVYASETEDGRRLSDARVKDMTGSERLSARAPYATEQVEFDPSHKLVISGNHKPAVADNSEGMWRRVILVLFGVKIPEAERVPNLRFELRAEGAGILNLILTGLRDWQAHGLRVPATIKAATAAYRAEQDVMGEFVTERCEVDGALKVRKDHLYGVYRSWCEANGHKPMSAHRLTRELAERGFRKASDKRHIVGLHLSTGIVAAS